MRDHHTENISMRAAWTLIELIFVIIIIGYLASLAIGKMAATRDDAKLSSSVANMSICITDVSAFYVATGIDYTEDNHPEACDRNNTKCYDFVYAVNGQDFNVSINSTREHYCADIERVGGHLAKSYNFGGEKIKR